MSQNPMNHRSILRTRIMSASLFLSDAAFAHVERIWALTHVPRERRLNSWNMMSQIQKPRGLFPVDRD
jgi:hypothetical protein